MGGMSRWIFQFSYDQWNQASWAQPACCWIIPSGQRWVLLHVVKSRCIDFQTYTLSSHVTCILELAPAPRNKNDNLVTYLAFHFLPDTTGGSCTSGPMPGNTWIVVWCNSSPALYIADAQGNSLRLPINARWWPKLLSCWSIETFCWECINIGLFLCMSLI